MERIVFLDRSAIQTELRSPRFEHQWVNYSTTSPDEVVERLQQATIAITDRVAIGEAQLTHLPDLKFIAVAATGVDGIDLEACRQRGIAVSNVRGWSVSVPEHIFALILALRRNLMAYHTAVRQGVWERSENYAVLPEPMPLSLSGSTIGIIGYGSLGRAVARIAPAFGMTVLVAEHKKARTTRPGRTSFNQVLETSDVLVILCPLNEETRGLIGATELKKMRPQALVINCARGGIVDEEALAGALKRGEIGGAGIDVLSREPPREGNPLLQLKQSNLIVTPHVAWVSDQSMKNLGEQLISNLEAFVTGTPQNLVT